MIRYLDMFAGIGGFRSGLERVGGFECVGYCEIDKFAKQAYEALYDTSKEEYFDDARKIIPEDLPDIDLIVGGFPCQSFSIAGKRRGFEDARGTMFFEIARIAAVKRPRYLLLENVPGLLSHDEGRTFATILSTLDELGYDVAWQCLNSADFGVAQARKRVFIIGFLRAECAGEILSFPNITGMAVKLTGAVLMIMYLEPALALILIPGGFVFLGLTYAFRKILKRLHKNVQEKDGKLRIFIQEHMSDLMIVRAFGAEKASISKADDRMSEHQNARMERNHFSNLCNMGFAAVMNGAYLVGMIWCGYGILHDTVSYGTLMAVLQLISQIQTPFANITGYLPKYYAMLASADRLMEAESYNEASNAEEKGINEIKEFYDNEFSSIELKNICFSYLPVINDDGENDMNADMPQVLDKTDLTVHKGEYLALTGYAGCGKSTLLKVLMGIYEPDSGTRTINGTIPLTYEWRRLFSYVPQGNALMSGTIRETIAFSDESSANDETRMQQALKIACADRFVNKLKDGLDTKLGESGHGLSEGQMQRIAIARAIFSESPILLLDEATSSLDEKTEQQLLHNLKSMTGRTVVIITHHPAALEICDRMINFESGDDI